MRVEFGVGLTIMLFMVMLFAMVLFVVMFFMAMFFAMVFFVMVFLIVMLVTMLFVRVREEAGLNFGLFEGASGGGGEDEQRGAVAQCLSGILHGLFLRLGPGCMLKTDDVGAWRLQLDFYIIAFNSDIQLADAMLMRIGAAGRKCD
mgnify:FL=1